MHIKYYIEPRLLNTEINTTAFWNIRFSIDADTAVVSQAAPLSPPVENRYPSSYGVGLSKKMAIDSAKALAEKKGKPAGCSLGSPLIDGIFLVQKMCICSCVTLSTTLLMRAVQFNARSACDASTFTSCIYIFLGSPSCIYIYFPR